MNTDIRDDLSGLRADLAEMARVRKPGPYERWGKRVLDLAVALPIAAIAAPVLSIAAVAVKVGSPGPILFRQARVGKGAREFTIYKMRTMVHGNTADGQVLAGNPDVTRVGALLRRLKLDELPQVVNVLAGQMSLVGPRPCLASTAAEADENGRRRFLVTPGLTGLAQVNGNVHLSWPQRWELDRRYVDSVSLRSDLAILGRTISIVLGGEDLPLKKSLRHGGLTRKEAR